MSDTRELHRQACLALGMTDKEIEQDWAICAAELREQYDQDLEEAFHGSTREDRPDGHGRK